MIPSRAPIVMHRLRSKSAIFRLRAAALLICAKCVLWPLTVGLLAYALLISDRKLIIIAVGMMALSVAVVVLQWLVAQRTNCPLCITPVLAKKDCSKSRHSKSLFGSHRLRTALSILFTNSFRCPYCHEPTVLEVRDRHRHSGYSKS